MDSASVTKRSINDLPQEMLLQIFSNLRFEDLLSASGVCTLWNQIARDKSLNKKKKLVSIVGHPDEGYEVVYEIRSMPKLGLFGVKTGQVRYRRVPFIDALSVSRVIPVVGNKLEALSLHSREDYKQILRALDAKHLVNLYTFALHDCDSSSDLDEEIDKILVEVIDKCEKLLCLYLRDMPAVNKEVYTILAKRIRKFATVKIFNTSEAQMEYFLVKLSDAEPNLRCVREPHRIEVFFENHKVTWRRDIGLKKNILIGPNI